MLFAQTIPKHNVPKWYQELLIYRISEFLPCFFLTMIFVCELSSESLSKSREGERKIVWHNYWDYEELDFDCGYCRRVNVRKKDREWEREIWIVRIVKRQRESERENKLRLFEFSAFLLPSLLFVGNPSLRAHSSRTLSCSFIHFPVRSFSPSPFPLFATVKDR